MSLADDAIPVSALQHWLYCPRQCALIHVERLWAENVFTAEGHQLHARPDAGGAERRGSVKTVRNVEIASTRHGLFGVADMVELHGHPPRPVPVEYKRGRAPAHRADEVQLCAQALCLEDMFDCTIREGFLFYGANRRRSPVRLDEELRSLTLRTAKAVKAAIASGRLPAPEYESHRCDSCSLKALCRPKARRSAARWLNRVLAAGWERR